MRDNFRAPWDYKLIAITGAPLLLFGALLLVAPGVVPSLILWGTILCSAAFGVYGYSIQQRELRILRLGWFTSINLEEIANIEAKPHVRMGSVRTFANGGLFGYIGYYRNGILGSYRAYVTSGKKTVLIETSGSSYVISPDDPQAFTNAVKKHLQNQD